MNDHDVSPGRWRAPLAGGVAWAALLAVAGAGGAAPGPIEALLGLGLLVVVPLGLPLVTPISGPSPGNDVGDVGEAAGPSSGTGPDGRPVRPTVGIAAVTGALAAGAAAGATVLAGPGGSAVLAVPWLAWTAIAAGRRAWTFVRAGRPIAGRDRAPLPGSARWDQAIAALALGWLAVAAGALVASRAGWTVAGIGEPLVLLAAVHFTFAGFGTTAVGAGLVTWASCHARPRHRAAVGCVAVLTTGTVLVLVGHLTVRVLELVGAVTITAALVGIGVLGWSAAPARSPARWLLRTAALAVIVPMALALHYAAALVAGRPHLPFTTIAAVHGTGNALGFVVAGLVAWRLLAADARTRQRLRPEGPAALSSPVLPS